MRKLIYIIIGLFALGSYAQGGPKVDVIKFRGEVTNAVRDTFDVPVGETWLIWNESYNRLEIAQSNDVWKILLTEDLFSWPNVWTGSSNTFEKQLVVGDEGGLQGQIDLIGNAATSLSHILFNNNAFDTQLGLIGYNAVDGMRIMNQVSSKNLRLKDDGILDYNGQMTISDDAYDATGWNGNLEVPTKNAVRDEMELKGDLAGGNTWYGTDIWKGLQRNLDLDNGEQSTFNYRNAVGGAGQAQIDFFNNATASDDYFRFLVGTKSLTIKGDGVVAWNGNIDITGNYKINGVDITTGSTDDQTASEVSITDSGDYFTGTDVEAALQELGAASGSSMDWSTPVDSNITFDSDAAYNIGTNSVTAGSVYAETFFGNFDGANAEITHIEAADYTIAGIFTDLDPSGYPTNSGIVFYNKTDHRTRAIANGVVKTFAWSSDLGTSAGATLIDDDTFATASSTNIPSAESVKAYVDANSGSGGLQMHPDSPVTIDSLYVGTVAQIAAAGLGSDVLSIPTDAPPAETGTSATDVPLDGYFLGSMTSANTATAYTTDASLRRAGGYAKFLINAASEPTVDGSSTEESGATFASSTDMYLVIWYDGSNVKHFFLEK